MIRFTNKFPFISFKKKLTAIDYYAPIDFNTHVVSNTNNQHLIAISKEQLINNGIPLNKIRFVFEKSFLYDVDNNNINPSFKTMIPIKKKHPVVEIGKPERTILVHLGENITYNNFAHLKNLAHKSKKGVALLVGDNYEEVMWTASLDDAIEFYNESFYGLEYQS
jgi:hypothetical protein